MLTRSEGSCSESERLSTIWLQREMCTHQSRWCLRCWNTKRSFNLSIQMDSDPSMWSLTLANKTPPSCTITVHCTIDNAAHPSRLLFCGFWWGCAISTHARSPVLCRLWLWHLKAMKSDCSCLRGCELWLNPRKSLCSAFLHRCSSLTA